MKVRTAAALILAATLSASLAAAPIDGTFSYQGRLTNSGAPITGTADVRFSLWDDPSFGTQIGAQITVLNIAVANGLFDVDLDFGVTSFDGQTRWLRIDARSPAGSGGYTTLSPRQEILPAPYAIQTRGLFVDEDLNVGIGTTTPGATLHVAGPDAVLRVQDESQGIQAIVDGTGANVAPVNAPSPFRHLVNGSVSQQWLSYPNGGQYRSYDLGTGAQTSAFGTSQLGPYGFLAFNVEGGLSTVSLHADKDGDASAAASARLWLGSANGGNGGEIAIINDSNTQTISLLGGSSGNSGTLSLLDHSTRYAFFRVQRDGSTGGGGFLEIYRNDAGDPGFIVEGNYLGDESVNVHINGSASSVKFLTDQTGNFSAILPIDSISAEETGEEPGVASAVNVSATGLTSTIGTILSRTIDCPASGYCVVIGSCEATATHTTGTTTNAFFGVSDNNTALPTAQDIVLRYSANVPSGTFDVPVTVHGTFEVSPGVNTFYMLGQEFSGAVIAYDSQLTVMFFPTAYGTVTPTILARQADDAHTPVTRPMSPYDIRAEQADSVAFARAQRDAQEARYEQRIAALEDRMRRFEDEQTPRRVSPPSPDQINNAVLRRDAARSDPPSNP